MNTGNVMTRRVICVREDDDLLDAAKIMLQDNISGLPVVAHNGDLVGIITEGDFLRRAEIATDHYPPKWPEFLVHPARLADQYKHSHGRKVRDVMTHDVITVSEDLPLDELVALMERKKLKRLPVVAGRRVAGIVTRADLLKAVVPILGKPDPALTAFGIRKRIEEEIAAQDWPISDLQVLVQDGEVHLIGRLEHDDLRAAIKMLAANVPGVVKVVDHLRTGAK